MAFFPRTDAGQFTINMKVPTGTRIEVTEQYVKKVEDLIHRIVSPHDFKMVVSNIGVVDDFTALYTNNAGEYTSTVQVELNDDHAVSSFDYMASVRKAIAAQFPDVRTFFQSGSMVDAIINSGMPAPIDVQVSSSNLKTNFAFAQELATRFRALPNIGEVYIPQDMNYPAIRLDVDRVHAGELGLSQKDVVDNVIAALNSELHDRAQLLGRRQERQRLLSYRPVFRTWRARHTRHAGSEQHSLAGAKPVRPTTLDNVVKLTPIQTPTEVDHHQIQRVTDVYVTPAGEDLGQTASSIRNVLSNIKRENVRVDLHGMVEGMQAVFQELRIRLYAVFPAALSHSGRAVQILRGSGA